MRTLAKLAVAAVVSFALAVPVSIGGLAAIYQLVNSTRAGTHRAVPPGCVR